MEGKKKHSALQARARTLLNNICKFAQDCIDCNDTDALYRFTGMVDDILSDGDCEVAFGGVLHV